MAWCLIKLRVIFAKLKISCKNCIRRNCDLLYVLDIVLKDALMQTPVMIMEFRKIVYHSK